MNEETEKQFDNKFTKIEESIGGKMRRYITETAELDEIKQFIVTHFVDKQILEEELERVLRPHGYISDDPKIEKICQDIKIKALISLKEKLL